MQDNKRAEREKMYRHYLEFVKYVKGGTVEPHWMADGHSFWFAEGAPQKTVIWKVDPVANTKEPLFDTERLRRELQMKLGRTLPYQGIPFSSFSLTDAAEHTVRFTVESQEFLLGLDDYSVALLSSKAESEGRHMIPQAFRKDHYAYPNLYEVPSPDGKWLVGLKEHNLYLRSSEDDRMVMLTNEGLADYSWGDLPWGFGPLWSPDSRRIAVLRKDFREVPKVPIVNYLGPEEQVKWEPYPWHAEAPVERTELCLIEITSKQLIEVDTGEKPFEYVKIVGWKPDGSEFLFLETDRHFREVSFAAASPETGVKRRILEEDYGTTTSFWAPVTLLDDGQHFIWHWDRDGWKHLYLYDLKGKLIRRLTQGDFPVERIVTVDGNEGWVYLIARTDRSRPYDTHVCRVHLKRGEFSRLTDTTGQHDLSYFGRRQIITEVQFSPSQRYFLDSHSTVTRPPAVDLRSADGDFLQTLVQADIEALKSINWSPPEEFVVKGADQKVDLFGIIYKPHDFDPSEKCPVIEQIYGGHRLVPRNFLNRRSNLDYHSVGQAMAQLGFIVFMVDGRGPGINGDRGRDFEEITWGTFGRYEIPDHVAALNHLAETRPYMDLKRVGITGGSLGGYFAVRGMLQAPDVYHVGVAVAPVMDLYCHPNSSFLGSPETNRTEYEYSSNVRFAGNLKGKLLLIHGTADLAVPLSHTIKLADALTRENKPFDMLVIPGWGHWGNERLERYWTDLISDYFVEHLMPKTDVEQRTQVRRQHPK